MGPLLSVKNLKVSFNLKSGPVQAVNGVSFEIGPGETLGVVGESGSGKSVTALTLMGLLDRPGRVVEGITDFKGRNLLSMTRREMQDIRGREMAMVFQDHMSSLNPLLKVGRQITEVISRHLTLSGETAGERALKLMGSVGLERPDALMRAYPFQLSGGMRQRVMLAMALAANPSLLIADEPTTALDVTVQAQIIKELQKIQRETGMSLLVITHNWGVVAELADRVAVMYAGRLVETGRVADVYRRPAHPYSRALLSSLCCLALKRRRLVAVPGQHPALGVPGVGCEFAPRCRERTSMCSNRPEAVEIYPGHIVTCHLLKTGNQLPAERRRELALNG